ncbi:MAG: LpqB family beta-propeller domain-containing protein, partial [Acidobacteriota bacterium]
MKPGDRLGNYEIIAPLGAGGMGEVYRAHDPKLKRDIAIKVLPPELAGDRERRERFEREAVAVAALDHPNIVTVYSVEEADGRLFITMQLVEGKTLAELIPRHGLPVEQFFKLAVPLADAVSAAHERGVTHRDLKPANVMVAPDGRIRVLDFGLAKLIAADTDPDAATHIASEHLTEEGKILGTVAYMSPEQAEGRTVDHRSDIFSLGILMYEMITGEAPFVGDTKISLMSSIVKDTPKSVTEINPRVPRHLGRIIRQALEKDVSRRYQTARDLRNQLQDLQREVASGEVLPVEAVAGAGMGRAGGGRWLVAGAFVVGALLVALAIAFGGMVDWGGAAETAFVAGATERVTRDDGMEVAAAISPDGDLVAYSEFSPGNQWRVYVQQIGPGTRAFTITETGLDFEGFPQWSPDGTEIAFLGGDGAAHAVPALGGRARVMVRPGEGFSRVVAITWSPDGDQIAYAATGEDGVDTIFVQPADRSEPPRPIAGAVQVSMLAWSPSGNRIAYAAENRDFFFTGNKARSSIRVASLAGGGAVVVDDGSMNQSPAWTPDGRHLLFVSDRDGSLDAYQIEVAADGSPVGEPRAVTRGSNLQSISLSRDGTRLAYSEYRKTQNLWALRLPQDGPASLEDAAQLTRGDQEIESVDVSQDGTLLLYDSDAGGNQDIYSLSLADGTERQLTNDPADDFAARWSPDASKIAFHSLRTGKREVFVMGVDEGLAPKQFTSGPFSWDWVPAWSPDGAQIAFASDRRGDTLLIFTMASDTSELEGGVPRPLTDAFSVTPTYSPDGNWLAFHNDTELWVMRPDGSGKRMLHRGQHVFEPHWSTDSREILIALRDRPARQEGIWAVPVDGGEPRLVVPIVNDRI